MSLRQLPIYKSTYKPNLFLGGDRELVMLSGLLSAILIFVALDVLSFIVGVCSWFISLAGFRLMAKHDPLLRQVYLRHRKYKQFYPARSTPFRSLKNKSGRGY